MPLDDKQKKTLEELDDFVTKSEVHPNLPLIEELRAIRRSLEMLAEKEMPMMEVPEVHKAEIVGAELVTIKGEKGEKGDTGEKGDRGIDGVDGKDGANGKDGKDGKDGETPRVDYDTIINETTKNVNSNLAPLVPKKDEIIEDILKDGNVLVDSINASDNKIERARIEGLDDELNTIRKESSARGGVRRVYQPYVDDFSGQTNGVLKSFTLSREPLKSNTILVWGSDFPIILRPTTDFTVSGKVLTLTSAVPAPNQGATLLIRYDA